MMKGTRGVSLLLCVVLCAVLLSACGKQEEPPQTQPSVAVTQPQPEDVRDTEIPTIPTPQPEIGVDGNLDPLPTEKELEEDPGLDENELPPVLLY